MDSNKKPQMSLDLIDKAAILVYAAKFLHMKPKNNNALNAFCFKDKLEKGPNKFTESRRLVRNVGISISKSTDTDYENDYSYEEERGIDRQNCETKMPLSAKSLRKEHECFSSSAPQTGEKAGKICAKFSQKVPKNTNALNGSAFCFIDELDKCQHKFTQSRRPVRNMDISSSMSTDSDDENDYFYQKEKALDRRNCGRKMPISAISHRKEHECFSSSPSHTGEKAGKICQIPDTSIEDEIKCSLISLIEEMQQSTTPLKELNSPSRVIPKVSNSYKKPLWQIEQSELESSESEPSVTSTISNSEELMTVSERCTRSELISSHVGKIPQTNNAEQNEKSFDVLECSQMTSKILMPTNRNKKELEFDKGQVKTSPFSHQLPEQTLHSKETLGINLSIATNQQAGSFQSDEKPESFFRKWYAFAKVQKLLNVCSKECDKPYTEPKQPPDQILCRMKYR